MEQKNKRKAMMATKAINKPKGAKTKEIRFKYSDGSTEPNIWAVVDANNNSIVYDFVVRGSFLKLNSDEIGETKRRDNKTLQIAKSTRERLIAEKEQIKADRKRGIYTVQRPPREIEFFDFAKEYYTKKQRELDLKDKSIKDNLQRFVNHTGDTARVLEGENKGFPCGINKWRIYKITPAMLDTLVYNSTPLNTLSSKKKNAVIRQIKAVFNDAMSVCNLTVNPAEHLRLYKETREERNRNEAEKVVSEEQMELLSSVIKYRKKSPSLLNSMYEDAFYFLFKTGLRISEFRGVRFKDIDYNSKEIVLKEQLQNGQRESLKNDSSKRRIPLNDGCMEIIEAHKRLFKNNTNFSDEWYIFGGDELDESHGIRIELPKRNARDKTKRYRTVYANKPLGKNGVERALAWSYDYIEKNGLYDFEYRISPHGFRHSYASVLISKGVNIAKVSKLLGHATVEQTIKTYLHIIPEDDVKALEVLNADAKHFRKKVDVNKV
ncbi:tyrosine-type recombinase/integrase [Faecalitalea cylindroides]|uniref:tyrosine-type recombinase/integrase n=1 Tax=Faecalitalea cylindroides TaxID=39483 RepID=UPI0013A62F33|nr:site-specific integrase [Faecalitalea cylindroides]